MRTDCAPANHLFVRPDEYPGACLMCPCDREAPVNTDAGEDLSTLDSHRSVARVGDTIVRRSVETKGPGIRVCQVVRKTVTACKLEARTWMFSAAAGGAPLEER